MVDIRNPADDPKALDELADALERSDSVDASRIVLSVADDGVVVLRGAVATVEQADQAALLASELADDVRNELRVDVNVREDITELGGREDGGADSSRRGADLATQEVGGDLTTDVQESLDENIPLDPPDEPVFVPTAREQRGGIDAGGDVELPADAGDLDGDDAAATQPSLADMSPEELARSARPGGAREEDA